ncbi:MAG: peptidoglycan DD-metalloendopeptidase family protein [Clostridia bacterium]|nr:peptidoglycan DD-metalloendopeptidase family protein [Clostridia bacterium]
MKVSLKRIICILICMCITLVSLSVMSLSEGEKSQINKDIANLKAEANAIQAEINKLKAEKSDQAAILAAIRKKIANTQAMIDRCNEEIESINSTIAENKAKIAEKEAEIADEKLAFKKRLRESYMSSSGSTVQILLSAKNFSEFLRLTEFTSAMSVKDKKLIEQLQAEITVLNAIIKENEELLDQQMEIKATIDEQQAELKAQESEAAAIYNQIAADQKDQQDDLDAINAEVKKLQKKLEDEIANGNYKTFINPNTGLQWPVNGHFYISAHYQSNDAVHKGHHNGMDIAGGNIAGQPIRAVADGYVDRVYNGCTHNYGKSRNCCGNGYGNYATVNHGTLTINGSSASYVAYYAHATKIIVSPGQYVKQGDIIGYVGTTGWSTGYHLHFGLLKNGGWINPYPLFF